MERRNVGQLILNCKEPTDSIQQSASLEANRSPASQEIPLILQNPEVNYHFKKHQLPVLILSHINPIHAYPSLLEDQF
jgi:hypothetical protein